MIPITYEDESKETQTSAAPWGLIAGGVALIGGVGGVYAYAVNQNKKRRAAANRAAASRRAATQSGTQPQQPQQAQSPYARRAAAMPPVAPPVAGSRQNTQTQNRAGSAIPQVPTAPAAPNAMPYANATKNPFSGGSITGAPSTGENAQSRAPYATQNPYAAQQSPNPYASASTQNPYAGAKTQNPFDAVKSEILGTEAQPQRTSAEPPQGSYTNPVGAASVQEPQRSNPYARPIGTGDAPAASGTDATRRRSTRMQRYHAAEDDSGENGENR